MRRICSERSTDFLGIPRICSDRSMNFLGIPRILSDNEKDMWEDLAEGL